MENVKIDWIMVTYDGIFQGVKKNMKPHYKIMSIEELKEVVMYLTRSRPLRHPFDYLIKDVLVLKEGVFRWEQDGYKKLADKYSHITESKPAYEEVIQ